MRKLFIFISVIFMLFIFSCSKKSEIKENGKNDYSGYKIDKTSVKGPVETRVLVNKDEISMADSLEYLLKIKYEKGYKAYYPEFNDKLFGGFLVKDRITYPKEYPDTKNIVLSEKYILEPFLSGEYKISGIPIKFTEVNDTKVYVVETKPVTIKVDSLLDTGGEIPDFRESIYLVELKSEINRMYIYTTAGLIIFLALAISSVLFIKKYREKRKTELKISASEIAYRQIKELIAKNLIEQKLIKEFYYEISSILRIYLENRFDLRAPEQTTEEFLEYIVRENFFHEDLEKILRSFLHHCDLVKYARFEPEEDDIQKTFDIVKNFIEKTKIKSI